MAQKYMDPTLSPEARAEDLLRQMTLEEKVNQLACMMFTGMDMKVENGMGQIALMSGPEDPKDRAAMTRAIQQRVMDSSRFGIPAIFHCEALSGPVFPNALAFPTSISLSATFAPEIVYEMAENIRRQMLAVGTRQALSPVLDIERDLRWGRVNETYGGDPTLVSEMSCAFVSGLQGTDYTQGIAATAKHFLGYSATEGGLNMARTAVSARDLRAVYAKPFEAAIRKSNLLSVMNSYSEWDGRPICADKAIMHDLLRDDLGFEGLVVSDYMSVDRLVNNFHVAADMQDAAVQCLENGLDVELPMQNGYGDKLVDAVKKGLLDEKYVDISAKRSLTLKFRLGLFENPFPQDDAAIEAAFDNTQNNEKSLEAARKAMTLLKNDGILPLRDTALKVAVIGPSGNNLRRMWAGYTSASMQEMLGATDTSAMAGLGTNSDTNMQDMAASSGMAAVTEHPEVIEPAIRAHFPAAKTIFEALSESLQHITFTEGCSYNDPAKTDFAAAEAAAKAADLVIVTVGGKNGWGRHCTKGEGIDSASFGLPGAQEQLLRVVGGANKNFIVVHTDAYPLVSPYAFDNARAILEGWLCCAYAGQAIAETLLGQNNPGGKTPMDIPYCDGITPFFHYQNNASSYKTMSVLGGGNAYIDKPAMQARPFGYGLSYTTFAYSDVTLTATDAANPEMTVSVKITNTGNAAGDEVVQLYGKDVVGSIVRPYHELVGFRRITLAPGESKIVSFTFALDQLAFIDKRGKWIVEAGEYRFFAAANADDETNAVSYSLAKTAEIDYTKRSFFAETSVL